MNATESIVESTQPETVLTPKDQLNALINRRMGEFEVRTNRSTLKYLKNSLQQKIEWKGPNEAYLIIMALLSLDNVISDLDPKDDTPTIIKLPSSTIESINFFLTKITGTGIDSAQKLFSVSMMLRPTMEALRKLDEEIEVLKSEVEALQS